MNAFTESVVEQAALDWFRALGNDVVGGPDMPPGPHALRESYADMTFPSVVRDALDRLTPNLPAESLDDAFRNLTRPEGSSLEARNRAFHRRAVNGVTVEYRGHRGAIRGAGICHAALRSVSIGVYTSAMRRTQSSTWSVRVGLLQRRKVLRLAATLPWALLVAGCGQKGPLYHPPEPEPEPDEESEDEQTSAAPPAPRSPLA